ncbi:MAG: sensor histidine kinase [Caldilineaceae bacterium]
MENLTGVTPNRRQYNPPLPGINVRQCSHCDPISPTQLFPLPAFYGVDGLPTNHRWGIPPRQQAVKTPAATQAKAAEANLIAAERQRIAREIHDGVAQDLAALALQARCYQRQLQSDPAALAEELEQMHITLDTALVELRRIICGLRPACLEEQGLVAALHALAAEFSAQHPLYVHFRVEGDETHLPQTLEHPLFRIAQEALHNAARHAQATLVEMRLTLSPDTLTFSLQDNGCGFTATTLRDKARTGHLGLQQMQERVATHQGVLFIDSAVGQGTRVTVKFALS